MPSIDQRGSGRQRTDDEENAKGENALLERVKLPEVAHSTQ